MKHDLTLIDLPTLMPEDTVLDVLKFLVDVKTHPNLIHCKAGNVILIAQVVLLADTTWYPTEPLRTVSAFTCGRCNNSHAVGALRYHVEMAIADDTAEGTFVWFDGYTFQVRVTAFNFTEHHKTFTITRIAEELGRAPVDDNGGGDDDDNDVPPGKPTPDEFGSGGAIGDSSKVVKKVCVG
ncbi:hypothetical protein YC2023_091098 [Brassica napus]